MSTQATPIERDPLEVECDEYVTTAALVVQEKAAIVKISDDVTYQKVCTIAQDAASNIKKIETHLNPQREAAYARWKKICGIRERLITPFEDAKKWASRLIGTYQYEQEQERQRKENEEQARVLKEAEELQAQQATQLADEGRVDEGLAVLDQTPILAPVAASRAIPKVSGIGTARVTYKAEVTNLKLLVAAIAAGTVPINVIEVDQSALNKLADLYKDTFEVPGCKLVKSTTTSIRASK